MVNTDKFFDAITDERRRRVLIHMLDHNPEDDSKLYVDDIVIEDADLEMLLVEMHHTHLPKLEEYGFIDWDKKEEVVTKGPNFEEIRPVLELLDSHRDELPDDWL